MENKRKWYSILIVSLVLLTASVTGCGQVYLKADLDAARQAAGEAGYSEGYATGKAEGYDTGHDKGYETGYEAGKADGYKAGHDKGYETGKAQGYEAGFLEGNKAGYAEGYEAGLIELKSIQQEAEKLGYVKGYEAGIAAAQQEAQEAEQAAQRAAEAKRAAAMARLDDLAYIKANLWSYSDDADPEADGVELTITFYDSKSARIYVSGVPITVSYKIYAVSGETSRPTKGYDPLIYQNTVSINSTMERIKTFKISNVQRKLVSNWLEVTVTTPNQKKFSVTDKAVWLR